MKQIRTLSVVVLLWLQWSCGPIDMHVDRSMTTWFEESDSMGSPGYEEGMAWWRRLDTAYRRVSIVGFGLTDAGRPLHVVFLANEPISKYDLRHRTKPLLLINNAIHAGEPDGVDATMMLFRDILEQDSLRYLFKNVIIACIPYYNIGGALNRNSHSRANQEGPEEYGFRGNAQNLDLNRDFIKLDSRNSRSFAEIIRLCDPEMYVETHVSNGADYPYTMTYIATLSCKSDSVLKTTMDDLCIPQVVSEFERRSGQMISPYVNVHGSPPDNGFAAFYDAPRYSTGYLSTIGIPGFITETHMLKPFKQRVMATYHFEMAAVKLMHEKGAELKERKLKSREAISRSEFFGFNYEVDTTKRDALFFKGYRASYKPSEISGSMRLYYNRDSVWSGNIPYYRQYTPGVTIRKPKAYLLKKGYFEVEERLRALGVKLVKLNKDTLLKVESYTLSEFETSRFPYERHYFHYNTRVAVDTQMVLFRKGDYMVETGHPLDRLIMTILEPEAEDSYFNWNFYDAVLQQKEGYSDYVFEDKAAEYLKSDSILRREFERMKDTLTAVSTEQKADELLRWVYKHSPYYEKEHLRYPVYRLL